MEKSGHWLFKYLIRHLVFKWYKNVHHNFIQCIVIFKWLQVRTAEEWAVFLLEK